MKTNNKTYAVHCDCQSVRVVAEGQPKVHAFCHCEDCRELLNVPYHSVLAFDADKVKMMSGASEVIEYQHPTKKMKRVFCKHCGDILYNTNAMGWKIISQLLLAKSNQTDLQPSLQSNAHFFYDKRIVNIKDSLPKR